MTKNKKLFVLFLLINISPIFLQVFQVKVGLIVAIVWFLIILSFNIFLMKLIDIKAGGYRHAICTLLLLYIIFSILCAYLFGILSPFNALYIFLSGLVLGTHFIAF
jgi:hypothetical protein